MKHYGLLFQPDMARANVAGLKTMTRLGNGLKEINQNPEAYRFDGWVTDTTGPKSDIGKAYFSPVGNSLYDGSGSIKVKCPWQVGDLIYQKETHFVLKFGGPGENDIRWKANDPDWPYGWTSALFMPKKAARFWAEIVSIKVERVRDISAEDCHREGLERCIGISTCGGGCGTCTDEGAKAWYRRLYDSINGLGSFDRDWCWVIKYREVKR